MRKIVLCGLESSNKLITSRRIAAACPLKTCTHNELKHSLRITKPSFCDLRQLSHLSDSVSASSRTDPEYQPYRADIEFEGCNGHMFISAWHIVSTQRMLTLITMIMLEAGHNVKETTSLTSEDL